MYTCIYMNSLELITYCSPTMVSGNEKSKNLVVTQSHEAECLSCPSVYAGIPKKKVPVAMKEWMC